MASIKKIIGKRGISYKITVTLGRDINGKRIERYTTYSPETTTRTGKQRSEKSIMQDVEEYARQFEKNCKENPDVEHKLTVKQLSERWLAEYCEMQLSPTTINSYRKHLDQRILPRFGTSRANDISPYSVQKFINDIFTDGERLDGKTGKSLSPATIKKIQITMSAMFTWAVSQGLLESNPCKNVRAVRQTRKKQDIKSWDAQQARSFIAAMQEQEVSTQYKLFFHIALFCGMRRGEIIALRWSDLDQTNNKINVSRTVIVSNGKVIEKEPKTQSSIRAVIYDSVCANLIRQWQREQFIYRNNCGDFWKGEDFLFIQENGMRMHPDTPHKKFKKIISKYNKMHPDLEALPEIPMHGLRHTSATLLIANGVDVRSVSARLGHAKTSTTMDIYAHALESADENAANILSQALAPAKNPNVG